MDCKRTEEFPGIKKACLLIALDNGGINRDRSEAMQEAELETFLAARAWPELKRIDEWLSGLSEADMETVCAGEYSEMQAAMETAPAELESLLCDYFEGPC